jgi:regulator of protease activity HflC (stomatin/prohibitin superfamily)
MVHVGDVMAKTRSQEREVHTATGYLMILICLGAILIAFWIIYKGQQEPPNVVLLLAGPAVIVLAVIGLTGLYVLQPNEAAILMLFGSYRGTDRSSGLRWTNPLNRRVRISLRAYNFASDKIKVNDQRGNPIEIAAAIVWRVRDTAQAVFDIDDYENYVHVQAEAAIRHLASRYPYDEGTDDHSTPAQVTLRAGTDQVTQSLMSELGDRLEIAGIHIEDAKLTHLAYAPEIAGVMLRRQQAEAIIAARTKIVTGAVSMVEMALNALSERRIIELDDERKAAMVSNLLVVLCAETDVQPVVNAGTLYN